MLYIRTGRLSFSHTGAGQVVRPQREDHARHLFRFRVHGAPRRGRGVSRPRENNKNVLARVAAEKAEDVRR